jgi:hypothetical protein
MKRIDVHGDGEERRGIEEGIEKGRIDVERK